MMAYVISQKTQIEKEQQTTKKCNVDDLKVQRTIITPSDEKIISQLIACKAATDMRLGIKHSFSTKILHTKGMKLQNISKLENLNHDL